MESNVSNSDTNVKASFPYVTEAYGSTSPTSLVAKIHDIESHILEDKLVLFDDDERPINPCSQTNAVSKVVVGNVNDS
ncbi:hypothetical protein Tco_0093363 [Tanacetum coccineum]